MLDPDDGVDHSGQPWVMLDCCGGGIVEGKQVTSYDCFRQATLLEPNCLAAWFEMGCAAGPHEARRCFERAVQCEKDNWRYRRCQCTTEGKAWACLAAVGGGKICDEEVDTSDCVLHAMGHGYFGPVENRGASSDGMSMWCVLGRKRGFFFRGRLYRPSMCFEEAVRHVPSDAVAWLRVGRAGGDSRCKDWGRWACYQKARHLARNFDRICYLAGCRNPLKCSHH